MLKRKGNSPQKELTFFDRHFFTGKEKFTCIGTGSIGGKAHGLSFIRDFIESDIRERFMPTIDLNIPTLTVIATDFFDLFMKQNGLYETALSDMRDDQIAHAFQKAELPAQLVGDLRALISQVHTPLAIRSSSMLEDAMFEPFASVYVTKMIPNNQFDTDFRFRKLVEAIKFIYASTFFRHAKNYIQATKHKTSDEKMAVIIQEVVGTRHDNRFYPHISGVARSYNFYPLGYAKPREGVVDLALGLGKIIVDEGIAWSYSPSYPQVNPPYNFIRELLKQTQTDFWAIRMSEPPMYDPIREAEYMRKYSIAEAESDGVLPMLVSTYRHEDERILIGASADGPRIIDFAPILKLDEIPLNDLIKTLLEASEEAVGSMVEIEFAVTLDERRERPARFGFLQVRPMVVSHTLVDVSLADLMHEKVFVASESVLGNGLIDTIRDIVYVRPDRFNLQHTGAIAEELEAINRNLVQANIPYLLIGYGRWGSSDPQGGIPVNFGQISGAKVIVEATLPKMNLMLSQGSHFFHNITSFKILYFSVPHGGKYGIGWNWLQKQKVIAETEFIRHARLPAPLLIKVDGRIGRGVICHD